jgi:G3E family GTPase
MIPLTVLTGYLGSGKTSLLARLLKSPSFARTAVIINEFGEVGLDHDLIETGAESFLALQTGCLCCRVRDDLSATLEDLLVRRDRGLVPPFERIVIETSGLADPAPILQTILRDSALLARLELASVLTTVDAINAQRTLAHQPEAVKQIAFADHLILTKTDLLAAPATELAEGLRAINPRAPQLMAPCAMDDLERLFATAAPEGNLVGICALNGDRSAAPHEHFGRHGAIATFSIVREQPLRAAALTLLLEALAQHCGDSLLRLKGILNIAESPGRPAVVHAVQHLFHAPQWLAHWPSADQRSRLVFIVRDIAPEWVLALLRAIEIEVGEIADRG